MHVIKLDGYNATVDNGEKLELGTFDSFGEEQLQIVKAPDWVNLSVIATFNPPNRKPVQAERHIRQVAGRTCLIPHGCQKKK